MSELKSTLDLLKGLGVFDNVELHEVTSEHFDILKIILEAAPTLAITKKCRVEAVFNRGYKYAPQITLYFHPLNEESPIIPALYISKGKDSSLVLTLRPIYFNTVKNPIREFPVEKRKLAHFILSVPCTELYLIKLLEDPNLCAKFALFANLGFFPLDVLSSYTGEIPQNVKTFALWGSELYRVSSRYFQTIPEVDISTPIDFTGRFVKYYESYVPNKLQEKTRFPKRKMYAVLVRLCTYPLVIFPLEDYGNLMHLIAKLQNPKTRLYTYLKVSEHPVQDRKKIFKLSMPIWDYWLWVADVLAGASNLEDVYSGLWHVYNDLLTSAEPLENYLDLSKEESVLVNAVDKV